MILHFSHANGFPAACYRKMFSYLEPAFEIGAINTIGHDPRHPVTDSWPHLVAELIERLERYREPVLGVGHSLGGYLTALAALRRPALFRAIILLDSLILARWQGTVFKMVKRFGLADRVTPAGMTRDRRAEWASADEAYAHFRNKRALSGRFSTSIPSACAITSRSGWCHRRGACGSLSIRESSTASTERSRTASRRSCRACACRPG